VEDRPVGRPAERGSSRARTYKGYRIYAYIALTRLFAELDLDLSQPDLEERVVTALGAGRGRVSKEEVLHAIRSNSHMTDKVLDYLVGEAFVTVAQDERSYDIRVTPKGVEHLRLFHRFYRDLYRRELAEHYRYVRPPGWLG
jgi:predicted transcriptional regulator